MAGEYGQDVMQTGKGSWLKVVITLKHQVYEASIIRIVGFSHQYKTLLSETQTPSIQCCREFVAYGFYISKCLKDQDIITDECKAGR